MVKYAKYNKNKIISGTFVPKVDIVRTINSIKNKEIIKLNA